MPTSFSRFLIVAMAVAGIAPQAVRGDVLVLHNGGRIEGEIQNSSAASLKNYVVKTAAGVTVSVAAADVERIERRGKLEAEYEAIRPTFGDTVDEQWKLAEWCREHHLLKQRTTHLARIIELDPEHIAARRALGYSRVSGQWKTHAEVMTAKGYVRDGLEWRLPQEVELRDQRAKRDQAERGWFSDLRRWRGWLDDGRAADAAANIARINDPHAIPALAQNVAGEPNERVRYLYFEALARIGTHEAYQVLAGSSLEDPHEEARLTCVELIEKADPQPDVVGVYVRALRSKDNAVVNRAAVALEKLNDPVAIAPLIDALMTKHQVVVDPGGPSGGYSATFSPDGTGGGLSVGGGPKAVRAPFTNREVLDALVSLTGGVDFGYDVKAWKFWLSNQKRTQAIDARRD